MNATKKPVLKMIVAMSKNRAIGKDNTMPWHLSSDLKRFKALTTGHTILMGKHTFESLPVRPLKNRRNVVVSTSLPSSSHYDVARSLDEALKLCAEPSADTVEGDSNIVYIIGGANLYSQCMDKVDEILVTHINETFKGDRFFPELDPSVWHISERSGSQYDEKSGLDFEYITYSRSQ